MKSLTAAIVIIILVFIMITIDGFAWKSEYFNGTVIDKKYKTEENSTGVGVGSTSSGGSAIVVASSHEDEKFLVVVKTDNNKYITVECKPKLYYSKKTGQKIQCYNCKGLFTGIVWSRHGLK